MYEEADGGEEDWAVDGNEEQEEDWNNAPSRRRQSQADPNRLANAKPLPKGGRRLDKFSNDITVVDVPLLSEPLKDPLLCDIARKDANRLWGVPATTTHNPCSKPASVGTQDLERLATRPWAVADKSDGKRFQLLLGTWPDPYGGQPYALLVDERCSFYEVLTVGSEDYYKGSLLDGELVQWREPHDDPEDPPRKVFLAFDAIAVAGERVAALDFYSRLRAAIACVGDDGATLAGERCVPRSAGRSVVSFAEGSRANVFARADWESACVRRSLEKSRVVCVEPGLAFSAKTTVWPLDSMRDESTDPRGNVPYPTDGLILTSVAEPVCWGRTFSMLKVKFDHTIDLRVVVGGGPDGTRQDGFYFQDGEWEIQAQLPAADGTTIGFFHEPGAPPLPPNTADIWECRARYDGLYSVYLCPVLKRQDKPEPNDKVTVERTLRSVQENILPQDLYGLHLRAMPAAVVPPEPQSAARNFSQEQNYRLFGVDPSNYYQPPAEPDVVDPTIAPCATFDWSRYGQ